jgi:hypothetical protein
MKVLFGKKRGEDMDKQEQASFLQERHRRVKKFFEMVPGLIVEPTQFIVSGENKQDAHVFEIQRRIEGYTFQSSLLTTAIKYVKKYPEDKRREIGKTLEQIVDCYERGIQGKSKYVTDMNAINFILDQDGNIHLIDTNVEFDFSEESKIPEDILIPIVNHKNKNLDFFKKLSEFCLS